ncbi:MAG: cytochrome c peroxidase, partial [Desulfovibrionaceae bacterium]|nr:cytochrome c peroxidase [Desulfovibrionaceae bacterium]
RGYDLPFYAKVPGIREIIEKDYNDGLRAMDLNTEMLQARDKPIGETVLAKMEWVIQNDTMPPAKFAVVHWGSRLSDQEKKDILDWVKASRKAHYATDAAPQHANEPIQPLPLSIKVDEAKASLGDKLFNDKRLSTDSTLSCAGCHFYDRGGTDYQRFSEGIRKQFGDINPPSTYNAVFNLAQFWDGRAADLQEQAGGPPMNPIEMGSENWAEIIGRLSKDQALTEAFTAVYANGWTGENITNAIAEYEKTLITPNSRFDKWLRGDDKAISEQEKQGYARFKAYRCASCHVGKSVGGQSYEYLDLKKDYFADRGGKPLGSDKGRYNFTKQGVDLHRFKVPNLRNIELTAPYLHDGTVETLDDAVRVMGIYCSGLEVPQNDRELIVAFLRTLTGEHPMLAGKPVAK